MNYTLIEHGRLEKIRYRIMIPEFCVIQIVNTDKALLLVRQ